MSFQDWLTPDQSASGEFRGRPGSTSKNPAKAWAGCPLSARRRVIIKSMSRQQVLSTLQAQRAALNERFGVARLTLFGSVARDEAIEGSDVDLLVEFDRPVGLFLFLELQNHLETLIGCAVDLGTPESLKPRLRARVMAEAVHVV
jgi:predicted nucleotidyltransferase